MIIFRITIGRSFVRFPSFTNSVVLNPLHLDRETEESSSFQSSFGNHEISRSAGTDVVQLGGDFSREGTHVSVITQVSEVIDGVEWKRDSERAGVKES
jgi:hypothetical protein